MYILHCFIYFSVFFFFYLNNVYIFALPIAILYEFTTLAFLSLTKLVCKFFLDQVVSFFFLCIMQFLFSFYFSFRKIRFTYLNILIPYIGKLDMVYIFIHFNPICWWIKPMLQSILFFVWFIDKFSREFCECISGNCKIFSTGCEGYLRTCHFRFIANPNHL